MIVLPAVNPVLHQMDSSFPCQRAGIQAPTSLQENMMTTSVVSVLQDQNTATATKSLAQTFVICDYRAQRFIPPGVNVGVTVVAAPSGKIETHVWRENSMRQVKEKPSSCATELSEVIQGKLFRHSSYMHQREQDSQSFSPRSSPRTSSRRCPLKDRTSASAQKS